MQQTASSIVAAAGLVLALLVQPALAGPTPAQPAPAKPAVAASSPSASPPSANRWALPGGRPRPVPAPPADDHYPDVFHGDRPGQLRLRSFALVHVPPPLPAAPDKPFKLYYSFTFKNQPQDLQKCGLARLPLLTPWFFFKGSKVTEKIDRPYADQRLPDIKKAYANADGDIGVINIEGPWTIKRADPPGAIAAKINSHLDLAGYLRSRLGAKVRFGFYGEAPLKDYFGYQTDYFGNPLDPFYADFIQAPALAQAANGQIARLAASADALFPPYYTVWYDDMGRTPAERRRLTMQGWTTAAGQSMKVAKAWNKPVYPFIWMQYHNKINAPEFANRFLTGGFFRYQLETLKKLGADGVVIWGTLARDGGRETFDKNADWWRELLAFAAENGADLRACPHLPAP